MRGIFTLVFFVGFLTSNACFGQVQWEGDVSSDWATAGNWAGGVLPAFNQNIVIDASVYAIGTEGVNYFHPVISTNYGVNIGRLTIRNSGQLTISANLTGNGNNNGSSDIIVLDGSVLNHTAGNVTNFDDVHIDNATVNISGTANMVLRDDFKFEDDSFGTGTAGTLNVSGGNLTVGSNGSGEIQFNNGSGNAINITGGTVNIDALTELNNDTVINVDGGSITTAQDFSTPITSRVFVGQQTVSDDIVIDAGGEVIILAGENFTITGDLYVDLGGIMTAYNNAILTFAGGATQSVGGYVDGFGTITLQNIAINSTTPVTSTIDISVARDWTVETGSSFSAPNHTVTFNGTVAQALSDADGGTFGGLTINNSLTGTDAVLLDNDLSVTGILTLTAGILGTGGSTLTVCDGTNESMISGGSSTSFVNGTLARCMTNATLYDFPIGTGDTFKRAALTPSGNSDCTFQITAFSGGSNTTSLGTGLYNVSGKESWEITQSSGAESVVIRLYWETQAASEITDVAVDLVMVHYTGGQWEDIGKGAYVDADPGYIESGTAISSFSPFTFGSGTGDENPLPVTWLSFSGQVIDGSANLEWSTAAEVNNEGFYVEKSTNGEDWTSTGFVSGNGTTSSVSSYKFADRGIYFKYYRLRQVDTDGKEDFSKVISLNTHMSDSEIRLVKNKGQVGLYYEGANATSTLVGIYALDGRMLFSQHVELSNGMNIIPYSTNNSGQIMILSVLVDGDHLTFKFRD